MVGGPSSRAQLVTRLTRSTGDQLAPAPSLVSVPKSDSWLTSALAFSVRLPSALKSRLRREIGRAEINPPMPAGGARPFSRAGAAPRGAGARRTVGPAPP